MISQFIKDRLNPYINVNKDNISIVKTTNSINIQILPSNKKLDCIINLERVNNIRWINKFHEDVNSKLEKDGIYLSCGETIKQRKKRVKQKFGFGLNSLFYFVDFLYKRVMPKLPGFKKIYFAITKGHNRTISKAEILGRLISCGFEILEYFEHENLLFIISKKIDKPDFNMQVSYGPLFKMNRIGFKGDIIGVYKFRTMYPFSEYCQSLIIKENKLNKNGKILDDFRVTYWGKIFRKYWIDELPMFINFFKGELNIIGVRPLSKDYFSRYPKDLQELRVKLKPGLIPPYYVDLPTSFDEILNSEKKYIFQKMQSPFITDIKYFCKAFINIVIKGVRSQ